MGEYKKFRNKVIVGELVTGLFFAAISIPIIGLDGHFLFGLFLGTIVTVLNFILLVITGVKLMEVQSRAPVVLGYFGRLVIYGIAFFICIKIDLMTGLGCGISFMTLPVAILFIYGIFSRFPGAKKNPLNDWTEPKEWNDLSQWDEDDESKDF